MNIIIVGSWLALTSFSLNVSSSAAFQGYHVKTIHNPLFARPKKRQKRQRRSEPITPDDTELAESLQSKIQAKRPALGHVVPSIMREKGSGGSANPKIRPQGKAREAGLNNPSRLKIAGGSAKGRRLDSPNVYLRPMMGKVREAVYSTFTSFGLYESAATRQLDIFSGSGSVGLESLSRGASHCTFVDLSSDCCAAAQRNIDWCEFGDDSEKTTQVVCADALQALRDPASVGIDPTIPFQIMTICPPYEEIIYADLLDAVANSPVLGDDCIVLIEYPVELQCLPHVLERNDGGKLIGVRNRRYGRTVIAMYIANPTGAMEVASSRPEEFVKVK